MNEYLIILKFFHARRNIPMTINYVAKRTGLSNYKVRKWLLSLEKKGDMICFKNTKKLYSFKVFILDKKLILRKKGVKNKWNLKI